MTLVRVSSHDPAPTQLDVEKARDQLARCHNIDVAKSVRDKAVAVARYMCERKAGLEAQNYAAEIALRAARRIGELQRVAPKAKGTQGAGRPGLGGNPREPPKSDAPTLAAQGITKKQSMNWQRLAVIPEPEFEKHIELVKEKAEKLTTAGVLAVAGRRQNTKRVAPPDSEREVTDESSPSVPSLSLETEEGWDQTIAEVRLSDALIDILNNAPASALPGLADVLAMYAKVFRERSAA